MTSLTVTSERGLGGENLWCDEPQQGYVGAGAQLCVFRMHERGSTYARAAMSLQLTPIEMHAPESELNTNLPIAKVTCKS